MPKGYVSTIELFKGQLIVLLNDCPSLKPRIDRSEYTISGLRSIIIQYNQCQHASSEYIKTEEPIKFKFGIVAGPTLIMVHYNGGGDYLTGVKMTNCYDYLAGISFHVIFPRERAQWSLVNEIIYKPFSNTGSTQGTTPDYDRYRATFSFDMGYLKLNTLLRYEYPKGKIHPFADFGMSNGYAIKSKNSRTVDYLSWPTYSESITTEPALNGPRLYEFGILGGLGITFWKMSGELRYEWADGMSPYTSLHGYENSLCFILEFRF